MHEQIAGRDLAGALAAAQSEVRDDVLRGAAAYLAVDGLVSGLLLDAWQSGRSALRGPVGLAA